VKRCPKCMLWLVIDLFASRGAGRPKNAYCRPCQNEYSRAHYRRNAGRHNRRRHANARNYRKRNTRLLGEYLLGQSCVDCGEADTRVLEFDHVRGTKLANVAELCIKGVSWKRVAAEIAKCDIRCANCHRRKTVAQLGWWRNVGT